MIENDYVTPEPGSLQTFFDVSNLSTFVKDLSLIIPQKFLNGKVITLDTDFTIDGIDFHFNTVTINNVSIGSGSLAFIEETNNLSLTLGNIDVQLAMDAEADLSVMKLDVTEIDLKNLSFQLDFGTSSTDQVNW